MFGFAYGHKENGAVFAHMDVMYANALYQRGFVREGFKVINSLYKHCSNFEKSRIYPGIPEYIGPNGRGLYHYLTGSASWLLLTVLTEMFGVKGSYGDLLLEPKLMPEQFDDNGTAEVRLTFADRKLAVIFRNKDRLEFGAYQPGRILIDGVHYNKQQKDNGIKRSDIEALEDNLEHEILVDLVPIQ
jgi:cellobiose phosphorylase